MRLEDADSERSSTDAKGASSAPTSRVEAGDLGARLRLQGRERPWQGDITVGHPRHDGGLVGLRQATPDRPRQLVARERRRPGLLLVGQRGPGEQRSRRPG